MDRRVGIDDGRYAEEAAGWLARLDSETCSATDLVAFRRWLGADPMHAAAFRHAETIWQDSAAVVRNCPALNKAAQVVVRKQSAFRHGHASGWLAIAASVVVVAVAAIAYPPDGPEVPPAGNRHATTVGEQQGIQLADGSTMILDTKTVVVERYGKGERRVDVRQGQVQFDVESKAGRPFVVHTEAGTVTAVGTRFQVRVVDDGAFVTLLEGRVRVVGSGAIGVNHPGILLPGQRVRLDGSGRPWKVETVAASAAEAWTHGQLHVDDWTLQEFVEELNRYSDVRIRIDDPALQRTRLSGVFQVRDRDKLARLLWQGWGIQSRQVSKDEIILTRR